MEPCVYHLLPEEMLGAVLYPLSQMKSKCPDAWARAMSRYEDRPWLAEMQVSPLGCGWNDVIFFSPVHPEKIVKGLRQAGFAPDPLRCIAIPARSIPKDRTVLMRGMPKDGEERFDPYDLAQLAELADVPAETLEYYRECRQSGRTPKLFHGIAYVLYQGTFNINGLPVVEGR